MSKKGSRPSVVLASALLLTATSVNGAAPLALTGWDARAVASARTGALKRLERDECRKVFAEFMDADGRTLDRNLEEWGASPAEYIGLISSSWTARLRPLCRKSKVALVASPGVRRVFVCKTFAEVQLREPHVAESMVIHEILHTLGLGEAPMPGQPTSLEITQRVDARCR